MGVTVWPMIDTEADDALASAARLASQDSRVEKVCIWTPDKDLAQCVRGDRVVQVDRKSKAVRNASGVREKFGVDPLRIPDFLALVGDTADGYPGLDGIGKSTAAKLINKYGALESFRPMSWVSARRWPSSSRCWRRSKPTSRCSPTSTSCDGGDPRSSFQPGQPRPRPAGCWSGVRRPPRCWVRRWISGARRWPVAGRDGRPLLAGRGL